MVSTSRAENAASGAVEKPLTVVRLPEVNKRPVEPDLALLDLRPGHSGGRGTLVREMRWCVDGRSSEDSVVRPDRLEPVVVPQMDDAPREHVDA